MYSPTFILEHLYYESQADSVRVFKPERPYLRTQQRLALIVKHQLNDYYLSDSIIKRFFMSNPILNAPHENSDQSIVTDELKNSEAIAKSFGVDELKNGDWFLKILRMTISSYNRNARASYFQQKYPGMHPDELADKMISIATRYATLAGGIAGAAVTANEIATLTTFGMTAALLITTIGAEMIYLAGLQLRLILDLSIIYDIQLDSDDPEDMMMLMYYALGIAPTDLAGKGLTKTAAGGMQTLIKTYVSKDSLKTLQTLGRQVGIKILQRDILKFAVPVVSTAVGGSYNYITTLGVGKTAKSHFKNRHGVSDELRQLISRQNTYDLVFPAAIMYMANIDGQFSLEEKQLYNSVISRMSFPSHQQQEFDRLVNDEVSIMDTISILSDDDSKYVLIELLSMMALYDGELANAEREFLSKVAEKLNVTLDFDALKVRLNAFRKEAKTSVFHQSVASVRSIIQKTSRRIHKSNDNTADNKGLATND